MITDEYLEALQIATAEFDTAKHEELVEIARLARLGLACTPRPIADAPKDGTWLLGWSDETRCDARPITWSRNKTCWVDLLDEDRFDGGWLPTHFIPLSAFGRVET